MVQIEVNILLDGQQDLEEFKEQTLYSGGLLHRLHLAVKGLENLIMAIQKNSPIGTNLQMYLLKKATSPKTDEEEDPLMDILPLLGVMAVHQRDTTLEGNTTPHGNTTRQRAYQPTRNPPVPKVNTLNTLHIVDKRAHRLTKNTNKQKPKIRPPHKTLQQHTNTEHDDDDHPRADRGPRKRNKRTK